MSIDIDELLNPADDKKQEAVNIYSHKPIEEYTLADKENLFHSSRANTAMLNMDQVSPLLKKSLSIHWKQTHDLTEQSEHLERWGYKKLAAVLREDAEQEHQHAQVNIRRLEFYDIPAVSPPLSTETWPRHDMLGIINYNLASVREAAAVEKLTILAARGNGDEITANVMIPLLQGSEDGIRLYESYLKMIAQMGMENFLTLQV